TTAAHSLGRYGSSAALPKLWDTLRYFQQYWKGKADELAQNGEGVALEVELRNAIAHGRGWLATRADLNLIQSLCTSGRCFDQTRQDLEALQAPLHIELRDQTDGVSGTVAQYYGLENIAAIEAKIAQFPRGTGFVLRSWGLRASKAADELRR